MDFFSGITNIILMHLKFLHGPQFSLNALRASQVRQPPAHSTSRSSLWVSMIELVLGRRPWCRAGCGHAPSLHPSRTPQTRRGAFSPRGGARTSCVCACPWHAGSSAMDWSWELGERLRFSFQVLWENCLLLVPSPVVIFISSKATKCVFLKSSI